MTERRPAAGKARLNRGWRRAAVHAALVGTLGVVGMGSSCAVWQTAGGGQGSGQETSRDEAERDEAFKIFVFKGGKYGSRIDTADLPVRTDVVMLYESVLGNYPRIWNGRAEHGGTPVGMDLVAHLRKVREVIDRLIPDPQFDGLAVIDYESRPTFWSPKMSEEYKQLVRDYLTSANPALEGEALERVAEETYNRDSARFLQVTMGLCRQMRPLAEWGFYYYPSPRSHAGDRYDFMLDACNVLLPGCYPTHYGVRREPASRDEAPVEKYLDGVRLKVDFAREIARDGMPVYAFVRPDYHEMNKTYGGTPINIDDARSSILGAYEAGADGVVFWCHTPRAENAEAHGASLRSMGPLMREAMRRDREQQAAQGDTNDAEG